MAFLRTLIFGNPFDPKTDIPSLEGKVLLITGGNAGLGYAQLEHLLSAGVTAKIYLGARSESKAQTAIKDLEALSPVGTKVIWLPLDLTDLTSVKQAAETINRDNERLDILVNNAGIMLHPPGLTKDGYELQFGTNHIGHFLLTRLLTPLMLKTASDPKNDVRIVNLSSEGHNLAPKGGFLPQECKTDMASYMSMRRYGQSKLANHLFTVELTKHYPSITSVSVHPGGVMTNLSKEFERNHPVLTGMLMWLFRLLAPQAPEGALTQTWATVANVQGKEATLGSKCERKLIPGRYFVPVARENKASAYARDEGLAKKLWEWSEDEMQSKGFLSAADAS